MAGARSTALIAASLSLGVTLMASAAAGQSAPRIVSPGRADQNPPTAPSRAPRLDRTGALGQARNPQAPFTPFVLNTVTVEGSSLPADRVAAAYRPFIGKSIDNDGLSKLTQAVADAYARSDVALYTVLVPEQGFADGRLRLTAVEGRVESVAIRGHISPRAQRLVVRYLKPVEAERPLRKSTLQRYVSLIRDIPGLYPSLNFERGAHEGGVRLVIDASGRAAQLALGVNDRGTALLGRTQAQADGFLNSILIGGDQLKGTLVLPTDNLNRFQFYGLAYAAPIDADGTTLQANIGYLKTRPRTVPLQGSATSFGVQISHPFLRSFARNLYATIGLDGVNSDNALLGQTFSNDRSRALRLAASYATQGPKNSTTVSATLGLGVNGLGARTLAPESTDLSFHKLNVKVLDNLLVSRNLILRLEGFGQGSRDRLPASEQIALGGDEFGRAYEAAIIAGDYGLAGSAELAYRPAKHLPRALRGSEAYTFVDGGKVWSIGRGGYPGFNSTLASIGAGVRAQVAKRSVIQVEAARGLYNPVYYENREVWRVLVSARTLF